MKVALYARVSRDDLHCENQLIGLRNWERQNRQEGDTFDYFTEEISSRKTRPVKENIVQKFRIGNYDTIVVARIDRWARSLQELVTNVQEIVKGNGRFISILNGFD